MGIDLEGIPWKLIYLKRISEGREDAVGEKLRSNSGSLKQRGRRFKRNILDVFKHLKGCIWKTSDRGLVEADFQKA